jgi:hypothetical protein
MNDKLHEIQTKAKAKSEINLWLLAIAFTLFTFIISVNPALVKNNIWLSLQLTLTIPLLSSSTFARTRQMHTKQPVAWDRYGFITFIVAYSFLVNVVGILLSTLVSKNIGLIFWGVNILLAITYSAIEVVEDRAKFSSRLTKDGFFILIIVLAGCLPALGFI